MNPRHLAHIRVPHLRDGFIVAKVGIARKRDRSRQSLGPPRPIQGCAIRITSPTPRTKYSIPSAGSTSTRHGSSPTTPISDSTANPSPSANSICIFPLKPNTAPASVTANRSTTK